MAVLANLPLPLANYPSGSRTLGPIPLPRRLRALTLEVARCTAAEPAVWPSASTKLSASLEVEVDGQWVQVGAFSAEGGVMTDGADEVPTTRARITWDVEATRVRARVSITGGPLRTSGALIAED